MSSLVRFYIDFFRCDNGVFTKEVSSGIYHTLKKIAHFGTQSYGGLLQMIFRISSRGEFIGFSPSP